MNSNLKNSQGYVFLKPFNGIYLPTYVQNLLIKNFCEQKKLLFKLSVNEQNIKNCWMELFSILKNKKINIIVMTSIYILPSDKKNLDKLYKILKKRNKEFYFIFENLKCKNFKELKYNIKKYFSYKKLDKLIG